MKPSKEGARPAIQVIERLFSLLDALAAGIAGSPKVQATLASPKVPKPAKPKEQTYRDVIGSASTRASISATSPIAMTL